MIHYYAVGKPLQTETNPSIIFSKTPLKLDYDTFMARAFPENQIDLIFTSLENAKLYVDTYIQLITHDKYGESVSSGPPVITFTTTAKLPEASDTNFKEVQKEKLDAANKAYEYIAYTSMLHNNKMVPVREFLVPYEKFLSYTEVELQNDFILPTVKATLLFSDATLLKVEFPTAKVQPTVELTKQSCSLM